MLLKQIVFNLDGLTSATFFFFANLSLFAVGCGLWAAGFSLWATWSQFLSYNQLLDTGFKLIIVVLAKFMIFFVRTPARK